MRSFRLTIIPFGFVLLGVAADGAAAAHQVRSNADQARESDDPAQSVTRPFTLDHNRMIVEVEFLRPDGTVRRAAAWVDTGNPNLILAEVLARDLGLDLSGLKARSAEHSVTIAAPAPPIRLGGTPLDVEGIQLNVHPGELVRPGASAEANLPASAFRSLHVVFDYPAQLLTVARPGLLKPRGNAIPCRVHPQTGLFSITATMDGDSVPLGVDNGSAGTWVTDRLTKAWQTRHSEWPHTQGGVGSANFFGFDFETKGTLMRLPELGIGSLRARDVALLGLDQELFDWYSRKSAEPVVGFVGANVLRGFRLEIDVPARMTYWEAGPPPESDDLDIVGLTVRAEADGRFTVAGVATKAGRPTVADVRPGDGLVRIGKLECTHAKMGSIIQALRGIPGSTRTLLIEREGKQLTVEAKVVRFP